MQLWQSLSTYPCQAGFSVTRIFTFLSIFHGFLQAQFSCKQLLLQRLVNEPEQSVRRAVADVTAIVAKHTVAFNQWNELLGFLHQCSQSPSAAHREVALTLFGSITEVSATVRRLVQNSLRRHPAFCHICNGCICTRPCTTYLERRIVT